MEAIDYPALKEHLGGLIGKRCTVIVAAAHEHEFVSSVMTGTLCHRSPEGFRARMERDLGQKLGVEAMVLGFEEHPESEVVVWAGAATGTLQGYDSPRLMVLQAGMAIFFEEHLTLDG